MIMGIVAVLNCEGGQIESLKREISLDQGTGEGEEAVTEPDKVEILMQESEF